MIYINVQNDGFNDGFIDFVNENGQYHRENGPAVIVKNHQAWYKNGKLHREYGPAIIKGNYESWFIEGVKYTKSAYHRKLKEMGLE